MHITDQGPTLLELHMLGRVACIDENLGQLTVKKEQFAISLPVFWVEGDVLWHGWWEDTYNW